MATVSKKTTPKPVSTKVDPAKIARKKTVAKQDSNSASPALNTTRSVNRATKAFKNFSLSKFAGQDRPTNYLQAAVRGKTSQGTVSEAQRTLMDGALSVQREQPQNGQSLSISMTQSAIDTLLKSYDPNEGIMDAAELVQLLERKRRGFDFYLNGNPTLKSISVQDKVQRLIAAAKGDK